MPTVCLYLQVHQPHRIRPFSYFEAANSNDYLDTKLNTEIISRVASRCYLPICASLQRAIARHKGRFSVALSLSGTVVEQMISCAPDALKAFQALVASGGVELLAETYHHSLASVSGDLEEFRWQVRAHKALIEREFGVVPRVFRNTELIHSDTIAKEIESLGFRAVIVEGIPEILGGRELSAIYQAHGSELRLLPRNCPLSDLIAFRLRDGGDNGFSLSPVDVSARIKELCAPDGVVTIGLDCETFGEHHQGSSEIVDFIEGVADSLLEDPNWRFATPTRIAAESCPSSELCFVENRSWADTEKDLSPWLGNAMQSAAFKRIYADEFRKICPPDLWRYLQTSDHFYYMSNKGGPDGDVHRYFRPFGSPYEAFIAYMNVLRGISVKAALVSA